MSYRFCHTLSPQIVRNIRLVQAPSQSILIRIDTAMDNVYSRIICTGSTDFEGVRKDFEFNKLQHSLFSIYLFSQEPLSWFWNVFNYDKCLFEMNTTGIHGVHNQISKVNTIKSLGKMSAKLVLLYSSLYSSKQLLIKSFGI